MLDTKAADADLEKLSALYDGEDLPDGPLAKPDAAAMQHLQNWSLIGSALRHELPPKLEPSFADNVMAAVEQIKPDLADQSEVELLPTRRISQFFKRAGVVCSQLAVAASVAAVTVIGWQTYSAGSVPTLEEPAANAAMGQIGGLSLASYQNDSRDMVINMNNLAQTPDQSEQISPDPQLLKEMQQKELERINYYVRGYILHSAAE